MAKVFSLWIGGALTNAHRIALKSFVHYGHDVLLYVYDMSLDVPEGVIKANAKEIIKNKDFFLNKGNDYASFSDYFRYVGIQKTGMCWVDADTICLSEYFFEDKEYLFIHQRFMGPVHEYAGGVLKAPKGSDLINILSKKAFKILNDGWANKEWGNAGPVLLTNEVKKMGLKDHAVDESVLSGVAFNKESPIDIFLNPQYKNIFLQIEKDAKSITFFNSFMRRNSIDLNYFPEGSAFSYLYKKFLL
jgi:hypothetical protein